MTPNHLLLVNASSTAVSAVALVAARSILTPLFGLETPLLLDAVAVAFFGCAGALGVAASRRPVPRAALLAFAIADAAWVVASVAVLAMFWGQLAPIARALVIAVALVVEAFAILQFRAAGGPQGRTTMSRSHA